MPSGFAHGFCMPPHSYREFSICSACSGSAPHCDRWYTLSLCAEDICRRRLKSFSQGREEGEIRWWVIVARYIPKYNASDWRRRLSLVTVTDQISLPGEKDQLTAPSLNQHVENSQRKYATNSTKLYDRDVTC